MKGHYLNSNREIFFRFFFVVSLFVFCPESCDMTKALSRGAMAYADQQGTVRSPVYIEAVPAEENPEQEVKPSAKHHSVVGGAFYFIGDVVAFPFKLLGGMIDAIF